MSAAAAAEAAGRTVRREHHPSAPEPRIVSRLVHTTFGLWFPFFRWMARRVPPVFLQRLAEATAERAIWEREGVREAILQNTARVLCLPPLSRQVEATARAMLSRHSRLWIDLLRHAGRKHEDPTALVADHHGDEHLLEAKAAGHGAILLTAHVGNFELGGLFLRKFDIEVSAVYMPDPSPVIESHREEARRELGVTGIEVTSSPFAFLPILRALREGQFVAMQGDRDVSGTGAALPFFGMPTSFPVGPFRLAALSGAPLLPVFVLQEDDGRYRTVVESPLRVGPRDGGPEQEASIAAAMRRFVAILERTICENPTQWYLFTQFWD